MRLLAGKARLVSDVPLITCPLTLRVCSPPSSKVRDFKVVTPSNALEPNVFTVLGISALSSDVFLNALLPITVRFPFSAKYTAVSVVTPLKASVISSVTSSDKVTCVMPEFLNRFPLILYTPSGTVKLLFSKE